MAIVGEPYNVDAHAKIPGLFVYLFIYVVKSSLPKNVVFSTNGHA